MPEDGPAGGAVTRRELAELAELFDRFEFAFDPLSTAAKEAESAFDDQLRALYEQRVAPAHPQVAFATFHARVRFLCRAYLKKNRPQSSP